MLAGLLAIGAPDDTERTVFRAATEGLHGGPHVFVAGNEIPAGGEEFATANAAAVVDLLGGGPG